MNNTDLSSKSAPVLSICILTYNREKFLRKLLDSILEQNNSKLIEILILDNGSDSNTKNLLKIYFNKLPNLRVIENQQNQRGGPAYRKLIEHARGIWVLSPGDDDVFIENSLQIVLEKCHTFLDDLTITLLPFGALTQNETDHRLSKVFKPDEASEQHVIFSKLFFESMYWMPATVFRRSSVINSRIPNSLTVLDWWLWINATCKGKVISDKTPIVKYRIHSGQEQKSYVTELWNLDQTSTFLDLIRNGCIHEYIHTLKNNQIMQLIELLALQVRDRKLTFHQKLLVFELSKLIFSINKNFAKEIVTFLISAQIDPRLTSAVLSIPLTKDDIEMAIEQAEVRQGRSLKGKIFANSEFTEIEEFYTQLLAQERELEKISEITPFERKIVLISRKIRNLNFIKTIFKR